MIYFIINPVAGNGKYGTIIKKIKAYMKNREYKILLTKKIGHAELLAKYAVKKGAERIIAVGGDGTLQEVCSGMAFSKIPLGILPFGSGNDMAKCIGVRKNIDEALEKAVNGRVINADLVKVRDRFFLNVSSVGIDAEIVMTAGKIKKFFKGLSYFVSVFKNIITYKPVKALIKSNGRIFDSEFTLIAVANGKYYGGGFKIAPNASVKDGLMDICLIEKIPRFKLFYLFPTVIFGKHNKLKYVTELRTEKIEIFLKENISLNLDGNIYNSGNHLEFKLHRKAIKLIV